MSEALPSVRRLDAATERHQDIAIEPLDRSVPGASVPTVSAEAPLDRRASRRRAFAKAAALAVVAGGLAIAYQSGIFDELAEPQAFARALVAMGGWGYLAFVVAYTVLQPFGVPGTVFIVAAPLIWRWDIAFALSMTGTMGASVVGFSFARFMARDWVAARIPARFRRYDDALERHAFRTVFVLRLIFWMPQALHFFLGVSKVRFSTHFVASFLGYLPPLFAVSYLGSVMFEPSGRMRDEAWPILGAMGVASLLIAAIAHYTSRARA